MLAIPGLASFEQIEISIITSWPKTEKVYTNLQLYSLSYVGSVDIFQNAKLRDEVANNIKEISQEKSEQTDKQKTELSARGYEEVSLEKNMVVVISIMGSFLLLTIICAFITAYLYRRRRNERTKINYEFEIKRLAEEARTNSMELPTRRFIENPTTHEDVIVERTF